MQECGIPESDIRGFRNPYLKTNPVVRQASPAVRTRLLHSSLACAALGSDLPTRGASLSWEAAHGVRSAVRSCSVCLPAWPQVLYENGFLYDRCFQQRSAVVRRCQGLHHQERMHAQPAALRPLLQLGGSLPGRCIARTAQAKCCAADPPAACSTLMEGPDTESISTSMGARAWPCE